METNPNNKKDFDDDETYEGPSWEKRSRRRNDRRVIKRDLKNLNWDEVDVSDFIDDEWEKFDGHKY